MQWKGRRMTTDNVREIEVGGQQLRVTFDFTPGTPDVMYLDNGDPGYPGDPEELQITKFELFIDDQVYSSRRRWIDVTDLVVELTGYDPAGIEKKLRDQGEELGGGDDSDPE